MGRRRRQKVRRRPQKRIPDVYPCPSCGKAIEEVNTLTEAVDIYGSFIDRFYEGRKAEVL
ncbi:MAG: hypothetical protein ACXABL_14845 [Candidatus Thorarchaeota archaeon]|jgi:transcription elongation factor Elf1